jgi:hypothetical protein
MANMGDLLARRLGSRVGRSGVSFGSLGASRCSSATSSSTQVMEKVLVTSTILRPGWFCGASSPSCSWSGWSPGLCDVDSELGLRRMGGLAMDSEPKSLVSDVLHMELSYGLETSGMMCTLLLVPL